MVADQTVEQAVREAERAQSQTPGDADPIRQSGKTGSVVVAQTDAACRSLTKIIQRSEAFEQLANGGDVDVMLKLPPPSPECFDIPTSARVTRTQKRSV